MGRDNNMRVVVPVVFNTSVIISGILSDDEALLALEEPFGIQILCRHGSMKGSSSRRAQTVSGSDRGGPQGLRSEGSDWPRLWVDPYPLPGV